MLSMGFLLFLKGQYKGEDENGNRYFEERFLFSKPNRPPRRWVWYKGKADPSTIPALWHGWMHFTHEGPLAPLNYSWIKPHKGNRTGTKDAYRPKGSLYGDLESPVKPYEAWLPNHEPGTKSPNKP